MSTKVIFFLLLIFVIVGCDNQKKNEEMIKKNEVEIKDYINFFYTNKRAFTKSELENMFYKKKCEFIYQDNEKNEASFIDKTEDLVGFFANAILKDGSYLQYEIQKLSYHKAIYDIAESKLFFIRTKVTYENLETNESFFLKREGNSLKIYRYVLEYN